MIFFYFNLGLTWPIRKFLLQPKDNYIFFLPKIKG